MIPPSPERHAVLSPFRFARWAPLALVVFSVAAVGCAKSSRSAPAGEIAPAPPPVAGAPNATSPFSASALAAASTRRVIRTGELWLDADAPDAIGASLANLAGTRGGFVVSSESNRSRDSDGAEVITATVVFRVPSEAFDEALAAAKALGKRVTNEKVTGQDVTEEYVDLEARIKAQHAVEEQYLSVLRQATSITDILAVQQKLGEVRTEIERAEGRRRFLENQTSLSTVTVHVARQIEAIETSGPGFGRSLREAWHDAVSVSVAIVNGAIRIVGVLLPVGVLVVAPAVLLTRAWLRRRRRLARPVLR